MDIAPRPVTGFNLPSLLRFHLGMKQDLREFSRGFSKRYFEVSSGNREVLHAPIVLLVVGFKTLRLGYL